MSSLNLSTLETLGVPVTPFEIFTNAISLADIVYKASRFLFEEKVQILTPKPVNEIDLNVGEADNLSLRINFHGPRIDVKRVIFTLKRRHTKRKSGVTVEFLGPNEASQKIFPPERDANGNAIDPNSFLIDTKRGITELQTTRIPVIAAGGINSNTSNGPYELRIFAFNKRIFTGKKSSWECIEESDIAIVKLWFRNPFSLQSFRINDKENESLPHAKDVEKVSLKLRFGYDQGNPNTRGNSGVKTCHCIFKVSCSPHLSNPKVEVEPHHSADIDAINVIDSSIIVNAKNLALETSRFFVFTVGYHHKGITDRPIEGIKEFTIQEILFNGITEAKIQRANKEHSLQRNWTVPIQFPGSVSTSVRIQES